MAGIRCLHPPEKQFIFLCTANLLLRVLKKQKTMLLFMLKTHIYIPIFYFFPSCTHQKIPYIFMFVLLFMDSICSDFLPRFRLHFDVKLHTFFIALNILLRALKIHFLPCQRSMIPARDGEKGKKIKHSDQLLNHRLHLSQPEKKAREKRGEKRRKKSSRKRNQIIFE